MPLPNFLLIGPPKCGTTALHAALACHPQVFMSAVKEPCSFAFDGEPVAFGGPDGAYFQRHAVTGWGAYASLFSTAGGKQVIGEASTIYLSSYRPEKTAARIHAALPMARLVAVLRQPVDRGYSAFTDLRARGLEPLSDFREALAAEPERTVANWRPGFRYWQNGRYGQNVAPYLERFPRTQIRIYLYEEWRDRPHAMLADLCGFLDIDPALLPARVSRRNVTRWVRNVWVERLAKRSHGIKRILPGRLGRTMSTRLRAWNQVQPPPLDSTLRSRLTERYRDDILLVQDLIGRDLSHWLSGAQS